MKMQNACVMVIAAVGGIAASTASAQTVVSFLRVSDIPGAPARSAIQAVSDDGQTYMGGGGSVTEPWVWTATTSTFVGNAPGGRWPSTMTASNSDGTVFVGYDFAGSGTRPFIWRPGGTPELLSSGFARTTAVSEDGSVVAGWTNSGAVRWTPGGLVTLDDFPGGDSNGRAQGATLDGSIAVGYGITQDGRQAAFWNAAGEIQALPDLPGGAVEGRADDISADGSTIVGWGVSENGREAVRWVNGLAEGLGDVPGGDVFAFSNGVSADGNVVVGTGQDDDGFRAFVWTPANGMQSIETLVTDAGIDLEGLRLDQATGVSADGTVIVGIGNPPGSIEVEGWVLTVSYPGPCNAADVAEAFGILDLSDVGAFVGAFVAMEPLADLDENGLYDLGDIGLFISAFTGGCP